ncbi:Patatin-like phospholipase [Paracoccus pantotrophus]|nr:Patatin-like phospholipase [Paracoccus pantotrophus]
MPHTSGTTSTFRQEEQNKQDKWSDLFKSEEEIIDGAYGRAGKEDRKGYRTGICLSGGGIRSATFALGVLQALAKAKLIKHLDYMSAVSGGGYIASAMALHYAQNRDENPSEAGDPDGNFPFKEPEEDDDGGRALNFLHNNANYLAPEGFRGFATGFYVVARSILFNLFIWTLLAGVVVAALMKFSMWVIPKDNSWYKGWHSYLSCPRMTGSWLEQYSEYICRHENIVFWLFLTLSLFLFGVIVVLMVMASISSFRPNEAGKTEEQNLWRFSTGLVLLCLPFVALVLWGAEPWPMLRSMPWFVKPAPVVILTAFALVGLWLVGAYIPARLRGGGRSPNGPPAPEYGRRRMVEALSGGMLILAVGFLLVGIIPFIPPLLPFLVGEIGGGPKGVEEGGHLGLLPFAIYLIATMSALFGFYQARLKGVLGQKAAVVIVAGSAILVYGAGIAAYLAALDLLEIHKALLDNTNPLELRHVLYMVAVITAAALCFIVNINDISLGRFYRDRLMEAYMPDKASIDLRKVGAAGAADRYKMREIANLPQKVKSGEDEGNIIMPYEPRRLNGPYPLICTTVMTPWAEDTTDRRRGGDSFTLSPLYCGSTVTSWQPTQEALGGNLSLPTAMAISGAAANPGGGFAGAGPTTNIVVATAMTLLSMRLGYWFRWRKIAKWRQWLNPYGNHLFPVTTNLLRRVLNSKTKNPVFVELSDGGHFENLGLYELVRRRCALIIVCDGESDPTTAYNNFTAAIRLIREDFAAEIEFNMKIFDKGDGEFQPSGPQHIVARKHENEYPKEVEFARRGYFLGTIRYASQSQMKKRIRKVPAASHSKYGKAPEEKLGPEEGLLIYLKSALIPGLSISTRSYRGGHPEFPYESTTDQFFSMEQFEAYRDVGQKIAGQMLDETDLALLFKDGRPSWSGLIGFDTSRRFGR